MERFNKLLSRSRRLFVLMKLHMDTGIIPFSDCGEFAASLVSGVVSVVVEGRVGSVKG